MTQAKPEEQLSDEHRARIVRFLEACRTLGTSACAADICTHAGITRQERINDQRLAWTKGFVQFVETAPKVGYWALTPEGETLLGPDPNAAPTPASVCDEKGRPYAVTIKACPRCAITGLSIEEVKAIFGYRAMGGKLVPQSYCRGCRSGHKQDTLAKRRAEAAAAAEAEAAADLAATPPVSEERSLDLQAEVEVMSEDTASGLGVALVFSQEASEEFKRLSAGCPVEDPRRVECDLCDAVVDAHAPECPNRRDAEA